MNKKYVYSIRKKIFGLLLLIVGYIAISKIIIPTIENGFSEGNPYGEIGFFAAWGWILFIIYFVVSDTKNTVRGRPILINEEKLINYRICGKPWKTIYFKDIILIKKPKEYSRKNSKGEREQLITLIDTNDRKIYIYNDILYENWREINEENAEKDEWDDTESRQAIFAVEEVMEYILSRVNQEKCKIIEY